MCADGCKSSLFGRQSLQLYVNDDDDDESLQKVAEIFDISPNLETTAGCTAMTALMLISSC